MERKLVGQGEEEVVILDGRHVDGSASEFPVTLVDLVEVTERDHGFAHTPCREVHHGVAKYGQSLRR